MKYPARKGLIARCSGRTKKRRQCRAASRSPQRDGWHQTRNHYYCPLHIPRAVLRQLEKTGGYPRGQCHGITKQNTRCLNNSPTPTKNGWQLIDDKAYCPLHRLPVEDKPPKAKLTRAEELAAIDAFLANNKQ